MFLSISCAVVTSLLTTYALVGCCVWLPIASASCVSPLAPTTLNAGGVGVVGIEPVCEEPPPLPPGTSPRAHFLT